MQIQVAEQESEKQESLWLFQVAGTALFSSFFETAGGCNG